ncbi:MAG: hypothetical protein C0613_15940 [Desulfobulbaceae bacterium]|nr:MAG: hypothetical protein C0613_15940 [Desulfobulbaceae bacterium]
MITEDQLEQICLEWFREGGYEYAFGPDIAYDGEGPTARDGGSPAGTGRLPPWCEVSSGLICAKTVILQRRVMTSRIISWPFTSKRFSNNESFLSD